MPETGCLNAAALTDASSTVSDSVGSIRRGDPRIRTGQNDSTFGGEPSARRCIAREGRQVQLRIEVHGAFKVPLIEGQHPLERDGRVERMGRKTVNPDLLIRGTGWSLGRRR